MKREQLLTQRKLSKGSNSLKQGLKQPLALCATYLVSINPNLRPGGFNATPCWTRNAEGCLLGHPERP
jgi:hypothetical protein